MSSSIKARTTGTAIAGSGRTARVIILVLLLGAVLGFVNWGSTPGGNVLFTPVPTNRVDGAELLAPGQRAKAVGLADRPLGPARFEFVTGEDLYAAMLDGVALDKWTGNGSARLMTLSSYGVTYNNGTKQTPCLSADLLGGLAQMKRWDAVGRRKQPISRFSTTVRLGNTLRVWGT